MLWVLKRTVSMRHSFGHPKQMSKLMDKKIFSILHSNLLVYLAVTTHIQYSFSRNGTCLIGNQQRLDKPAQMCGLVSIHKV